MTGYIKNILANKKFGFIEEPATKIQYFFHMQDYKGNWDELVEDFDTLGPGIVELEFDIVKSPKGPRAGNVKKT